MFRPLIRTPLSVGIGRYFTKHRGGSLLDYFHEKRRLLHLADANLPETSVVPLVIHEMTRECQRQVQTKSQVTVEDLLHALKNVSIDPAPSYPVMRTNQQWRNANTEQAPHVDATKVQETTPSGRTRRNVVVSNVSTSGERLECIQSCPLTSNETVFLVNSNILHAPILVNGHSREVLIGTAASVSLVNRSIVEVGRVVTGRNMQVHSYDGKTRELNSWTVANIKFGGKELQIQALVIDKVDFDFILSRPDMKRLRINSSWTNKGLGKC